MMTIDDEGGGGFWPMITETPNFWDFSWNFSKFSLKFTKSGQKLSTFKGNLNLNE